MKHVCVCVIGACLAAVLPAAGASPPIRGFGVDETLDRDAVLAPALDRARLTAPSCRSSSG
jgi:hypothetical protein